MCRRFSQWSHPDTVNREETVRSHTCTGTNPLRITPPQLMISLLFVPPQCPCLNDTGDEIDLLLYKINCNIMTEEPVSVYISALLHCLVFNDDSKTSSVCLFLGLKRTDLPLILPPPSISSDRVQSNLQSVRDV